jgi:hypothetical protein
VKHYTSKRFSWSLAIALLCSSLCCADTTRNQHGDFSFVFPPGWTLDSTEKDFTVTGPNDAKLSEMQLPQPPSGQTLESQTEFFVKSLALVWGANSTEQAFDLSGKKWEGRAVVLDAPSQAERRAAQIVVFVVKSRSQFRHFYFWVPKEEWQKNSKQFLAILRSLRVPG